MTKSKEHEFYILLLNHVKEVSLNENGYPRYGLCGEIKDLKSLNGEEYWQYHDFEMDFPILYSLRPKKWHDSMKWFSYDKSGWVKRLRLINKAIKLSAPKTKAI